MAVSGNIPPNLVRYRMLLNPETKPALNPKPQVAADGCLIKAARDCRVGPQSRGQRFVEAAEGYHGSPDVQLLRPRREGQKSAHRIQMLEFMICGLSFVNGISGFRSGLADCACELQYRIVGLGWGFGRNLHLGSCVPIGLAVRAWDLLLACD